MRRLSKAKLGVIVLALLSVAWIVTRLYWSGSGPEQPELTQTESADTVLARSTLSRADLMLLLADEPRLHALLLASQVELIIRDGMLIDPATTRHELAYPGGTLQVNRTEVNGRMLLTAQKDQPDPAELIPSHDYKLYAFSSPTKDVYLLDPVTMRISPLTAAAIEEYSKEKMSQTGGTLQWAYEPLISGDRQIVSYLTNRRSIQTGDNRDDIWAVDRGTGTERQIVEDARSLFWADRILYYQDTRTNNIMSYDYDTRETAEKVTGVETYQALDNKWISYGKPGSGSFFFYSIASGQTVEMQVNAASRASSDYRLSPDGRRVMGTMFADRKKAKSRKFFVFDLYSLKTTMLDIPGENPELAELLGWIGNDYFAASTRSDSDEPMKPMLLNVITGEEWKTN